MDSESNRMRKKYLFLHFSKVRVCKSFFQLFSTDEIGCYFRISISLRKSEIKCVLQLALKFPFVDYHNYYQTEKPDTKFSLIHLFHIMQ